VAELAPNQRNGNEMRQFLANPVPQQWVTDESVVWLARMANALGIRLEDVQLQSDQGLIRLADHPTLHTDGPTGPEFRENALASELALLDAASDASEVERMYAVLRLLYEPGKHEFVELLPRLIQGRKEGTVEPVDLTQLPQIQIDQQLRPTLGSWPHLG